MLHPESTAATSSEASATTNPEQDPSIQAEVGLLNGRLLNVFSHDKK